MYRYYLSLAWQSFRKRPSYVLLTALILGAGVGVFMTTYTLMHVLNGDPIPQKSERLLHIQIDEDRDKESLELMPSLVVQSLRQALPQLALVASTYGFAVIESDHGDKRQAELVRFADAGFFRMFDAPVLHGRTWSADEAAQAAPVAVIGRQLAVVLFGTDAAVGRAVAIGGSSFRVIGVLDHWEPVPRFYDLSVGAYAPSDQVYLPLLSVRSMDASIFMTRACPKGVSADVAPDNLERSRCAWLSVWGLLDNLEQHELVRSRVEGLLQQGRQQGWLSPASGARVENVRELLRRKATVPGGVKFGLLLAAGFLLLCWVNAAGLLLARCLRRSREIGVRRALGASRGDIAKQFMTEYLLLGLLTSVFGIAFAAVGVKLAQELPKAYMQLADMSLPMVLLALSTSMVVSIGAGVFPAWRASQIEPAIQIKID